MSLSRLAYALIILVALVFILIQAKSILIPFMVAIIVWFIIKEVKSLFSKIKINKKPMASWLSSILAFALIIGVSSIAVSMLVANFNGIAQEIQANTYDKNVIQIKDKIDSAFGISITEQFDRVSGSFDFSEILRAILNELTGLFGNTFLVLIYVIFLMLEERFFQAKIKAFYSGGSNLSLAKEIMSKIDDSMGKYMTLKSIVSLVTGIASFIALKIIGVDFAFFWAFIIFLLNFIPTIGSLVATIFPSMAALLQFGDFGPALWVIGCVGSIQVLVGNFIEPKLMGDSLNVSSLVVILSLSIWGWIWGIVGMILSVPITVMMIIAFAQFPATRGIAVLLSDKGEIGK